MKKSIGTILIVLFALSTQAALITPTGVTASSTHSSYNVDHLIDDSGLSAPVGLTSTHSRNFVHQWMSDTGDTTPSLIFDLGGTFNISAAHIWNYSYASSDDRGVKTLDISYSTALNGASLTEINTESGPQTKTFSSVSAQYIKFSVTEPHGTAENTGLSEVKFDTIPEPSVLALIGISGLGILASRRLLM